MAFFFSRSNIPFPLIMLFWYGILSVLLVFEHVLYIRFREQDYSNSPDVIPAHLAFAILGMICYAAISGPSFFQAHKYANSYKARNRQIQTGIVAIYVFQTFPMFFVQLYILYFYDFGHVLQAITFFLQLGTIVVGTIVVWFIYMWRISKMLHHKTGLARDAQISAARQQVHLQPPPPPSKALPGMPRII
eukprot:PhM_4_TR15104/c0_g1_i1/m.26203